MKAPGILPPFGFLCAIIALLLQMGPAWARELWVVDPQGLKGPENALLASIQGVLYKDYAPTTAVGVRCTGIKASPVSRTAICCGNRKTVRGGCGWIGFRRVWLRPSKDNRPERRPVPRPMR